MRQGEIQLELELGLDERGDSCMQVSVEALGHGRSSAWFYAPTNALNLFVEAAKSLALDAGYVALPDVLDSKLSFITRNGEEADPAVFTAGEPDVPMSWRLYRQVLQDMYQVAVSYAEDGEYGAADVVTYGLVLAIQHTGAPVVSLPNGRRLTLQSHSMRLIRHYVTIDSEESFELSTDEDEAPYLGDVTANLLENRGVW